jgi:RNA polymerase sigma factor (TIGR02999 family)
MPTSTPDVTELLVAFSQGDPEAFDRLVPLVYDDLRRIARRQLSRNEADAVLDTTGLVHESYLKMVHQRRFDFEGRAHFLNVAARAMRQVIIDHARRRLAEKRGGGLVRTTLHTGLIASEEGRAEWLLALDGALTRLGEMSPRLARVVECRFFAHLSEEETAAALAISLRTAQRDWTKARAWLREALRGAEGA